MSNEATIAVQATGPGATNVDLPALIEGSLVQLYGVIGAPAVSVTPAAKGPSAIVSLDKRDEHKVRAALTLISSHDGKPLRLELQ